MLPYMKKLSLPLSLLITATACIGEGDLLDGECDGDGDDDGGEDVIAGANAGHAFQGLAHSGRWIPPADVMTVGDQQDVQYTGAPPYNDGANCSGGATPGATTLRTHLLEYFPQTSGIGVYNCRVIAGTNSMSLHGVGRALDIMIPTVGGDADNDLGDPIAHWLIQNAEAIGIQTIIWDHTIWRTSYSPRQHELNASNPHIDHLHVELSVEGSQKQTTWYGAPFGPVPVTPFEGCEPLPAAGGVVEEDGPCLELHGPGQYWRTELGAGSGGSLLWTNAFDSTTPSNTADWKLAVSSSGTYVLAAYLDPAHAQFASTRYVLEQGSNKTTLLVDQSQGNGWVVLGTFAFDAAVANALHVYDNHDGAVGAEKRIAVDAVRLTVATTTPAPDPQPAPDDEETTPAPTDPAPDADAADEGPPEGEETPVVDGEAEGATVDRVVIVPPTTASGGCSASASPGSSAPLFALLLALPLALPLAVRTGSPVHRPRQRRSEVRK